MVPELFNRQIIYSDRLPYVQQIYDIMRREIHAGRWNVGDRLPGVKELADQSGQMIKTIQTVYRMLNRDGYINSIDRKGTYLVSNMPRNRKSKGVIGIIASSEQENEHVSMYYMHVLLSEALKYDLNSETKFVSKDAHFSSYSEICSLFGKGLRGIVFLYPFRFKVSFEETSIPWIYLCQQHEKCIPLVSVDVYEAYYELTSRLIALGHEKIIMCKELPENKQRFFPRTSTIADAYRAAMSDAGLVPAAVQGIRIRPHEYADVENFVRGRPPGVTAMICSTVLLSCAIVSFCRKNGIRVPGELSVGSIGSLPVWWSVPDDVTGGMIQDDHMLVQACFQYLLEQQVKGRSSISKVMFRPGYFPGKSIGRR